MKTTLTGAAMIATGLFCGPFAGEALAAEPEIVKTAPPPNLAATVAQQSAQIEQQQAQIQALQDQLNQLTTILGARVDKVEAATDQGKVAMNNPGPKFSAPNDKNTFQIIGAVQVTAGAVLDQTADGAGSPRIHGGTDIRRARIGVQGTAYSDINYQAEIDIAQLTGTTTAAARDVWVQYVGFRPFAITVGNQKVQNGLEATFSDRSNAGTFIEPSMMTQMVQAPGTRAVGLRVSTGGSNWSGSLGYFGDDLNNNNVAAPVNEGAGWHGRLTFAPIATKTALLHLGVSGYYRDVATTTGTPKPGQLQLRAQPEYAVDTTRLVDTGQLTFADTVSMYGLEALGFIGPVGLQAEYANLDISQNGGRPDLTFNGGYVSANWFVSGESRIYDPRMGVITRFTPKVNFDPASGTWGAWEVAARWSTLDLNSAENTRIAGTLVGARGGEETNYTAGVNWYWNPYLRFMLDYVTADVKRQSTAAGLGLPIGGDYDTVAIRVQQEW